MLEAGSSSCRTAHRRSLHQRPSSIAVHRRNSNAIGRSSSVVTSVFGCGRPAAPSSAADAKNKPPPLAKYPSSHDQCIRQAQEATKAAIADGLKLIEVEFPVTSLEGVNGDGEGQNEMNANLGFLRQYLNAWRPAAATTRVFFPDDKELAVARSGATMDPSAGRSALDAIFADTPFRLGYLTRQNNMFNVTTMLFGQNFDNWSPADLVKDSDTLLFVAYPSFNPKEELKATLELYQRKTLQSGAPIVIFNGELDRVRGGYYSTFLNPTIATIEKELMPNVEQAYYIHNFKGSRPGALFRVYPGPWQVMRRDILVELGEPGDFKVIWTGDKMPTLKEVSLEILPATQRVPSK